MRTIDADELLEHVWRDKVDSRELIAQMIENAPTVYENKLIWLEPKYIPLEVAKKSLFLCYRKGYALYIGCWWVGKGWRRISDNEPISPELVAQINMDF